MGSEEVLVQGGDVFVKGQLVPDGEPQLLHGEDHSFLWDSPPTPEGQKGSPETV
jgi:hypothetical protein